MLVFSVFSGIQQKPEESRSTSRLPQKSSPDKTKSYGLQRAKSTTFLPHCETDKTDKSARKQRLRDSVENFLQTQSGTQQSKNSFPRFGPQSTSVLPKIQHAPNPPNKRGRKGNNPSK